MCILVGYLSPKQFGGHFCPSPIEDNYFLNSYFVIVLIVCKPI